MTEERRLVTILFADVAGSTGLGEALDPEDLRALLARFFAAAREIVQAHGGTVEKFIGDAVMAVFGIPAAHDDDPARACAAALALRDRVRDDPALGDRLPIRVGVNTGEVVASLDQDGRGDFLVTGDAVNVAARLQQSAETWTVVAGERTVAAAAHAFSFGPLIAGEARGRATPVRSARVLGPATRSARRTPFVGRRADLAQLELVAERVREERRPYLVTILAPPGTGKTRLVEEFLRRLRERPESPRVAVAQCLPYGSQLTYWPLRGLIGSLVPDASELLGSQSTAPDALRRRLSAWLTELGVADPDLTAEHLAATIGAGAGTDAASDEAAVFAAWRRTLEAVAVQTPLALVVEDLHWSSDALLLLIESLLTPRAGTPMLILAIARPELLDRRPTWGGGRRNHVSLALEPLPDDDVATLVGGLLEAPTPSVVDAIVARADGNPFFAGELARALTERAGPGAAPVAVAAILRELPDTVQGAILARLDLLDPATRRAAQVASVLGRSFRPAALATLDPSLAADLDPIVDALLDRDLVRPDRGEELAFRHILIREVAYGMLPRAERARLHSAAAAALARDAADHPDDLAELVAFHYREAATLRHLLEPAAAEVVRTQAVAWLRRAAAVAAAAGANVQGGMHLRAAIALAERPELPDLLEALGDTRQFGAESAGAYADARALAVELGRSATDQLRLVAGEAIVLGRWSGGSPQRAGGASLEELIAEGDRLFPAVDDDRVRCRFLVAKAFSTPITGGDSAGARAAGEAAVAIARRIDDVALLSAALDALGAQDLDVLDHLGSLARHEERLRFARRLPTLERLDALAMVTWTGTVLGRLELAERARADSAAELPPSQFSSYHLLVLAWEALHRMLRGRWDETTRVAAQAEAAWEAMERDAAGYAQMGFLAALMVARARGDEANAARWLAIIEDIVGNWDGTAGLSDLRSRRIRALAAPDPAAIEEVVVLHPEGLGGRQDLTALGLSLAADRAHRFQPDPLGALLEQCREHELRLVQAAAARALGVATDDPALLREAIEVGEAVGWVPLVARARCELGLLTGDADLVEQGSATLAALGDAEQLARVEARRAGRGTIRP
ncbi:MAG: adenylate/guanylate cyclase domain-containing protein [Chloroflexota bacterium]